MKDAYLDGGLRMVPIRYHRYEMLTVEGIFIIDTESIPMGFNGWAKCLPKVPNRYQWIGLQAEG
jgi:hypothetical protein